MRKKPLVYLVEDDCVLAKIITWDLQDKLSCQVKTFVSGEEMINQLNHESPDIFLLDYFLPGMNGKEVLDIVKTELPETVVIGVSGQVQLREVQVFFNSDLDGAIEKDTDFIQQIRNRVEQLISDSQGEEEMVVEFDDALDKKIVFSGVLGLVIVLLVMYFSFSDIL